MSNLSGVAGTIGTVVGLGITLGALGLAFEFAGRAVESTKPRSQRRKGPLVFDTSLPRGGAFGGINGQRKSSRRRNNNIFDPMGNPRRSKGRRRNNSFGGDFF